MIDELIVADVILLAIVRFCNPVNDATVNVPAETVPLMVKFAAVIEFVTVRFVNEPTCVMFGCNGVMIVPLKLVALTLPLTVIFAALMELVTVRSCNEPTSVISGC